MKHLAQFGLAGAFRGWHEAILMNYVVSRQNSFWTEELGLVSGTTIEEVRLNERY